MIVKVHNLKVHTFRNDRKCQREFRRMTDVWILALLLFIFTRFTQNSKVAKGDSNHVNKTDKTRQNGLENTMSAASAAVDDHDTVNAEGTTSMAVERWFQSQNKY